MSRQRLLPVPPFFVPLKFFVPWRFSVPGAETLLCPHWPEVLQAGISSFSLSSHLHQNLIQQASSCPSRSHPPAGFSLSPLVRFTLGGSGGYHHAGDPDERDWQVGFDPDAEHPPLVPSAYHSNEFCNGDTFRMLSVVHRNGKPTPAFTTWEDFEVWEGERAAREWAGKPQENHETARLLRAVVDDLPPDVVAVDLSASGRVLWTSTSSDYRSVRGRVPAAGVTRA